MSRILVVLFLSHLYVVAVLGCHMSAPRRGIDKSDASVEDDSKNDGDRSTESGNESENTSDDPDHSNSNDSSKTEKEDDNSSAGSGGTYDNPPDRPISGTSTAEETGGTKGGYETAGTVTVTEEYDAGVVEEEIPELSCFDDECMNVFPLGDAHCCTTGDDPYSDAEDMCGLNLSALPMLPGMESVVDACIQVQRPGEIDSNCPEQQAVFPFFGGPGCCTNAGYCGGWADENFPLPLSFGCQVSPTADGPPVRCRLFDTPDECRNVYKERGELTGVQACVCDHCLSRLKACRRNLGCARIWECMLESGCRDVEDCYFGANSPCKDQFEQYDSASLSYALRVSNCVKSNCE